MSGDAILNTILENSRKMLFLNGTSVTDLLLITSFFMFFLGTNVPGLKPESSSNPSNSLDWKNKDKATNELRNVNKQNKTVQVRPCTVFFVFCFCFNPFSNLQHYQGIMLW